jgi:hypothetical protein
VLLRQRQQHVAFRKFHALFEGVLDDALNLRRRTRAHDAAIETKLGARLSEVPRKELLQEVLMQITLQRAAGLPR